MLLTFLNHQWKAFWRSRNRNGSLATQIVLIFFILYFLAIAIGAGFRMARLLLHFFPDQDVIKSFNGIILYYFALDFMLRLQLQELPTLSIVPYLHLKISKSKIVSFLNVKALFSAFNLWPFLLFFPFCFSKIATAHGSFVTMMYAIAIASITVFNNYLVLYIKRKSISNIAYTLVGLTIIGSFAALEYFKVISMVSGSGYVFSTITQHPFTGLFFCLAAFTIFKINSSYLRRNLYTEELSSAQEKKASTDYAFLNRFGRTGELAALELKLILRHKRSRNTLFIAFISLLYGFIFYKKEVIAGDGFGQMMFAAIFMTGISILTYGQFMFAWQSAHFDGLLGNKINFRDFIKAKFLLFTIGSTMITVLASFYGFLSPKLLLLHLTAYLYNVGFGIVVVLYLANFNYKRIDLNKSATFNYQGISANQWLLMFPYALTPIFIYLPFGLFDKPYLGLIIVSLFGLIMIIMRNYWINLITKKFEQQRYKIAEGFRA